MGKALYRKYRSKSFDEIIGQEHITNTLKNALKNGNISHAYLFTGPRGVGKTSIARILAHEINQLPYSDDSYHLDIIEIDAASNRRIDEIRELRERVHVAPTQAKYKVYIIDEVHMLTKEAFNALLKTLEEPPAHVVFMLATTEVHKLPETIVSRTQKFTLTPIEQPKVIDHLRTIATEEGFQVDDAGLQLLASHGGGSFRDSISMLDQARGHGDAISESEIARLLGIAPEALIITLNTQVTNGDFSGIIETLSKLRDQGYQAGQIAKQLSSIIRNDIVSGSVSKNALQLLDKLLRVPTSHDQAAQLELVLIDHAISGRTTQSPPVQAETLVKTAVTPKPVAPKKSVSEATQESAKNSEAEAAPKSKTQADKSNKTEEPSIPVNAEGSFTLDEWELALAKLKLSFNTLYSVARMAKPSITGNELTLSFGFAFHQKRINEAKNRQILTDVIAEVSGKAVTISCVTEAKKQEAEALEVVPSVAASTSTDALTAISNIFGTAEVLES